MAICANCKQSSGGYYEQDGLYYCNRCDTQSQTMQVMDADEATLSTKVSGQYSHRVKKKEVHKTSKKVIPIKMQFHKKNIPGAWKYQAMQLILQAQVNTLVNMGAAQRLKDVVGQLWFLYLHKLNIAFCDESNPAEPSPVRKKSPFRKRKGGLSGGEEDKELSKETTDDSEPGSPSILTGKTPKQSETPTQTPKKTDSTETHSRAADDTDKDDAVADETDTRETKSTADDTHCSAAVDNGNSSDKDDGDEGTSNAESFTKVKERRPSGNPSVGALSEEGTSLMDTSMEKRSTAEDKTTADSTSGDGISVLTKKKPPNRKKTLEKMVVPSMHSLLCLVYMGLRYIGEPILLCDIIRLVHENNLPFKYADHVIPQDLMKPHDSFKGKTHLKEFKKIFCHYYKKKCTLKHRELIRRLQSLHGLMDLPIFPSPNMAAVITRFGALLNLPMELNQYAYNLYSDHNPTFEKAVFAHDMIAMAFIIVALRVLLILDDKTEHVWSARAQRLRSVLPDVPVFVWDEWVCVIKLRREKRIADGLATDTSELHRVSNVDNFLSNYMKSSRVEDFKELKMKSIRDGWQWREERQKCFRVVEKSIASEESETQDEREEIESRPSGKGKRKRSDSCSSENTKKQKKETINVRKQMVLPMEHSEIKWEAKDELMSRDFTEHSMKYLLDFDQFCSDYGLSDDKQGWLRTGVRDPCVDDFNGRTDQDNDSNLTSVTNHATHSRTVVGLGTKKKTKTKKKKSSKSVQKSGKTKKEKVKSKKHLKKKKSKNSEQGSGGGPKPKKKKKSTTSEDEANVEMPETKDMLTAISFRRSNELSKPKKLSKQSGDSATNIVTETEDSSTSGGGTSKSKKKKKISKQTNDDADKKSETEDRSATEMFHSSDGASKSKKKKKKLKQNVDEEANTKTAEPGDMSATDEGSKLRKKESKQADDETSMKTTETEDMSTTDTFHSSDGAAKSKKKKKKTRLKVTDEQTIKKTTATNDMSTTDIFHSTGSDDVPKSKKKKKKKSKGGDDKANTNTTETEDMSTTDDGGSKPKKKKKKSKQNVEDLNVKTAETEDMSTTDIFRSSDDSSKSKKKKKKNETKTETTDTGDTSFIDIGRSGYGESKSKKKKSKTTDDDDEQNMNTTDTDDVSFIDIGRSCYGGSKPKEIMKKSEHADEETNMKTTETEDMSTTDVFRSTDDGSKSKKKKKKKSKGAVDKTNLEVSEPENTSTTDVFHTSDDVSKPKKKKKSKAADKETRSETSELDVGSTTGIFRSSDDGSKSIKKKTKKSKGTDDETKLEISEPEYTSTTDVFRSSDDGLKSKKKKKKKSKADGETNIDTSESADTSTSDIFQSSKDGPKSKQKKKKKKSKEEKASADALASDIRYAHARDEGESQKVKKKIEEVQKSKLPSVKKKKKKGKKKTVERNLESSKSKEKIGRKKTQKSSRGSKETGDCLESTQESRCTSVVSPFDHHKIDQIIAAKQGSSNTYSRVLSQESLGLLDSFDEDPDPDDKIHNSREMTDTESNCDVSLYKLPSSKENTPAKKKKQVDREEIDKSKVEQDPSVTKEGNSDASDSSLESDESSDIDDALQVQIDGLDSIISRTFGQKVDALGNTCSADQEVTKDDEIDNTKMSDTESNADDSLYMLPSCSTPLKKKKQLDEVDELKIEQEVEEGTSYPEQELTKDEEIDGNNMSDSQNSSDVSLYMLPSSKKNTLVKKKKKHKKKVKRKDDKSKVKKASKHGLSETSENTDTDRRKRKLKIKSDKSGKKSKEVEMESAKSKSGKKTKQPNSSGSEMDGVRSKSGKAKKQAESSSSESEMNGSVSLFTDDEMSQSAKSEVENRERDENISKRRKQQGSTSQSSLNSSEKQSKRKKKKSAKKLKRGKKRNSKAKIIEATNLSDSEATNSSDSDSVDEEPTVDVDKRSYQLYKDNMNVDSNDLPRSLVWLIQHCAWLIEVEPQDLFQTVCKVELLVMDPPNWRLRVKRDALISSWGCRTET